AKRIGRVARLAVAAGPLGDEDRDALVEQRLQAVLDPLERVHLGKLGAVGGHPAAQDEQKAAVRAPLGRDRPGRAADLALEAGIEAAEPIQQAGPLPDATL